VGAEHDIVEPDPEAAVNLRVLGYHYACERCRTPFCWVVGLAHEAFGFPLFSRVDGNVAVRGARQLLQASGSPALAARLLDRPQGARGTGHNPNQCPNCGWTADWYYFEEAVVTRAHHEPWIVIGAMTVTFAEADVVAPSTSSDRPADAGRHRGAVFDWSRSVVVRGGPSLEAPIVG
jgi:hypothetical protein